MVLPPPQDTGIVEKHQVVAHAVGVQHKKMLYGHRASILEQQGQIITIAFELGYFFGRNFQLNDGRLCQIQVFDRDVLAELVIRLGDDIDCHGAY